MSQQRRSRRHTGMLADLTRRPVAMRRRDLLSRYGRSAVERAERERALLTVAPGVLVPVAWVAHPMARAMGASLWAHPHGAIGGTAAAHVHGITSLTPSEITVVAPQSFTRQAPPLIRLMRPLLAMPHQHRLGIWVVPQVDAVLQCWSEMPRHQRTGMVIDAVREGHVSAPAAAARLAEYARLRDRRALYTLLDRLCDGIDSYLEHHAATRVFHTREFSGFERQVRVRALGRRYVLDMYHRVARVAIELDGRKYHSDDTARRRDLERDANLAAIGITTLRFTYEDITQRPGWCRQRVRRAVAARRAA